MNAVLLPYQQKWIEDDSQVKVAEKSRRVGLTWAEAADKVVTFSELGLADGSYSVLAQLVSNNRFIRSLAAEVTANDITLRLYHDNYPYHEPQLGAPAIKVGTSPVGEFSIGGRIFVPIDLFIRKEDL